MSLTMYAITVPALLRGFGVMSHYLDAAEAYTTDKKISPSVLLDARLYPDMMSLTGQVQRMSDAAKSAIVRLTGVLNMPMADTETSFDALRDRVAKTAAMISAVDPHLFEGSEDRTTEVKIRGGQGKMRGDAYVLQVLLPNFYFHLATAHDILRHNGITVGKADYFGAIAFSESAT
ncbi:DUF1993 domain-containing protein [Acidisoma cladoniae]|uniref:DUF1993 domain-containing protein n=1 Tax=Acidisoma cladoniae TaxID=3040935 RepID=UPI002550F5C3|nr:DUF1993 domain-containing protein [Acidisoma sp. PAMC 29798]